MDPGEEGSFKGNDSGSHPVAGDPNAIGGERNSRVPAACSEMKRKRDARNQADVDTEFRRGLPDTGGFEYDAREQISRVLATPPVTTDSPTRLLCRSVESDLTPGSRVNASD